MNIEEALSMVQELMRNRIGDDTDNYNRWLAGEMSFDDLDNYFKTRMAGSRLASESKILGASYLTATEAKQQRDDDAAVKSFNASGDFKTFKDYLQKRIGQEKGGSPQHTELTSLLTTTVEKEKRNTDLLMALKYQAGPASEGGLSFEQYDKYLRDRRGEYEPNNDYAITLSDKLYEITPAYQLGQLEMMKRVGQIDDNEYLANLLALRNKYTFGSLQYQEIDSKYVQTERENIAKENYRKYKVEQEKKLFERQQKFQEKEANLQFAMGNYQVDPTTDKWNQLQTFKTEYDAAKKEFDEFQKAYVFDFPEYKFKDFAPIVIPQEPQERRPLPLENAPAAPAPAVPQTPQGTPAPLPAPAPQPAPPPPPPPATTPLPPSLEELARQRAELEKQESIAKIYKEFGILMGGQPTPEEAEAVRTSGRSTAEWVRANPRFLSQHGAGFVKTPGGGGLGQITESGEWRPISSPAAFASAFPNLKLGDVANQAKEVSQDFLNLWKQGQAF